MLIKRPVPISTRCVSNEGFWVISLAYVARSVLWEIALSVMMMVPLWVRGRSVLR